LVENTEVGQTAKEANQLVSGPYTFISTKFLVVSGMIGFPVGVGTVSDLICGGQAFFTGVMATGMPTVFCCTLISALGLMPLFLCLVYVDLLLMIIHFLGLIITN